MTTPNAAMPTTASTIMPAMPAAEMPPASAALDLLELEMVLALSALAVLGAVVALFEVCAADVGLLCFAKCCLTGLLLSHGAKVMQHWDSLAATLVASPAFSRSKLSGKNAQSRMNQLVQTHREAMKEAELLSGVTEEVTERDQLLDELVELLDDAKQEQECKKQNEQKKRERDEAASLVARRADRTAKTAAICPPRRNESRTRRPHPS
ncbi:hypothetical protein ON010_g5925 [Phytophthora cinnamomi]|nr:hypothetical protein ON010_g5925 [Phytophthora cinnamomi]